MSKALKMLRAVQWAMLGSIVLYAAAGAIVRPASRMLDPAVSYLFTTLGVAIVGVIFVVRRTMVFRAAESLATDPDDALSLNQWKVGYLATYSLCEVLALVGLLERILGGPTQQGIPYYIGGFALMLFFSPRQPAPPAT
jgi:hypothetical protein